jgi:hypothetical protein
LQLELTQTESGHSCSVLRIQVRFVSLVAGIGGHPILLRRERMNHTRLESRAGEGPLGRQVVVSRSFHHDDGVLNVMLLLGLADLLGSQLKRKLPDALPFGVQ